MKRLIFFICIYLVLNGCSPSSSSQKSESAQEGGDQSALDKQKYMAGEFKFDSQGRPLPKRKLRNLEEMLYYYIDPQCQQACRETWQTYFKALLPQQGKKKKTDLQMVKLKQAAQQDDVFAQALYGSFLLAQGIFNEAKAKKAKVWLEKADSKGSALASHTLGDMYFKGVGVDVDKTKAEQYLKKAMKLGYVPSGVLLAELWHEQGRFEESYEQFKAYQEKGWPKAYVYLADQLNNGKGVKQDKARSIKVLEEAWQRYNWLDALNQLAGQYDDGDGVKQDKKKAEEYYDILIKNNHKVALAYKCLNGINRKETKGNNAWDYERDLCKRSADQGWIYGLSTLAYIYEKKQYKHHDLRKAKALRIKAAHSGHALSMGIIARKYMFGTYGFEKNQSEAFRWTKKAAELGWPISMGAYGSLLQHEDEFDIPQLEKPDYGGCALWYGTELALLKKYVRTNFFQVEMEKCLEKSEIDKAEFQKKLDANVAKYKNNHWVSTFIKGLQAGIYAINE